MAHGALYDMFLNLLRDIYDAENQIILALPKAAQAASHSDLKEFFSIHLDESNNQLMRLKNIFKWLNENPTGVNCRAIQGLSAELDETINKASSATIKDVALIVCWQKIEHYEISSYGSLRALSRHLGDAWTNEQINFDDITAQLLLILDEASAADERLTDIAEGGFFSQGINDEAESEEALALKNTNPNQNIKK